jgi:transmembrane 9 superfamily protein 2/4
MTYFQLCSENYHWWWRSFFTGAAIAPYVFLNAVFYYVTKFRGTNLTTKVLYFGYSGLLAFLVGILGGTIGFFASYWFVRKAYGSIKVD